MRRALVLLSFLAGCAPSLSAQSFSAARLDSLLTRLEVRQKATGSLAVSEKGRVTYARATGARSYKDGKAIPADTATRYRIGSITKMFTSVMIFQLIEEQQLSLDTRLSQFFPQIPNAGDITIGMMLSHRSGIRNLTADSTYLSWNEKPKTRKELVRIIANGPAAFPPDGDASYSNSNYVLLGFIVSDLTRKPYAKALKERITDRIGLKNTAVSGRIRPDKDEAVSFTMNEGRWQQAAETDASIPGGAGAISATPSDLTRFITALFAGRLIDTASLRQMTTLYTKGGVAVDKKGFGMGIFRFPFGERSAWGHNGGIDGFESSLCYFQGDSVAVALCLNANDYDMNQLMIGILSIVFNRPYAIPAFRDIKVADTLLAQYVGTYATPAFPLKLTVRMREGKLFAQATGQGEFPLDPVSETEFEFAPANLTITFKQASPTSGYNQLWMMQGNGVLFTKE